MRLTATWADAASAVRFDEVVALFVIVIASSSDDMANSVIGSVPEAVNTKCMVLHVITVI